MSKPEQRKRQRKTSTTSSDDDRSTSKKIHVDGYDDEFIGDAKDRAWLNTLSEREREAELLKRHEQREILTHREEITKKLQSKIKTYDDNDAKAKSASYDNDIYAEDDEGDAYNPSSNRRKQVNASKQQDTQHFKALKTLVEERKRKQDQIVKKSLPKPEDLSSSDDDDNESKPKTRPKTNKNDKLKVDEVYGSTDSDDSSHHRRRSRSPDVKEKNETKVKQSKYITIKSQLKPIVLSRFRMEKWCHAPFFNDAVKGAFVRINIGQNNGVVVYRLCQILGAVETGKVYNLGTTRTNKGLRLKHGRNERMFRLEFVSNTEISESEFKHWHETLTKYNIPLPTVEQVEAKRKEINKFKQYVFSNREISKIVEEKQRFRKAPVNYAVAKQELLKDIEVARDENDKKKENELKKKLNELEERASTIDRIRTADNSVLAEINRRNRRKTQQNVEHALVRAAQEQRDAVADPFTRRRCAPTLVSKAPPTKEELIRELHLRRIADEEKAAKKKLEEQRLLEEKNKAAAIANITDAPITKEIVQEKYLPAITTHERGSFTTQSDKNDDIFNSHDFELDLVI